MSRAKNTASVQDLCKCLKAEVACLDPKYYLDVDPDQVCKHYRNFLGLMFQKTNRLSKDCLKEAALKVYPRILIDEAKKWSSAIVDAVQHIRTKAKWSISSKKYEPWMGELVKIYLECPEFHGNRQKGKFVQKAIAKRRLMRQSSNASSIPQLPVNEPLLQKNPPGYSSETLDSQEHQLIEVSSEESQASPKKPVSAGTWIDSTAMVACRFVDGKVEKATMSEGPNGFAIAAFGENKFESEIPNGSLKISRTRQSAGGKKPAAVLKRPAAVLKRPAAVLKRPAAILKKPAACEAVLGTSEEEDVEARPAVAAADPEPAAVDLASPECNTYRLEDYPAKGSRKYGALGVRRNFGDKKQIKSFTLNKISREVGLDLAQKCIADLHNGATEQSVIEFLNEEIRKWKVGQDVD